MVVNVKVQYYKKLGVVYYLDRVQDELAVVVLLVAIVEHDLELTSRHYGNMLLWWPPTYMWKGAIKLSNRVELEIGFLALLSLGVSSLKRDLVWRWSLANTNPL